MGLFSRKKTEETESLADPSLLTRDEEEINAINLTGIPVYSPVSHVTNADGVGYRDAVSLGPVYRAVSILFTAASQLTLEVERGGKTQKTMPTWLMKPDHSMTRSGWVKQIVTSMAFTGNGFIRVIRDNNADPTSPIQQLIVQNANDTHAILEDDVITGWRVARVERTLRPHEIVHIGLLPVPGQYRYLGPIQAAKADIFGALEARKYGADFYNTSGIPQMLLTKKEGHLTGEQATEAAARWNAAPAGGARAMSGGWDAKPMLINPEDAQYLQVRNFSKEELATLFGIPARLMLVRVDSETYENTQDADRAFIKWTLSMYLREIEDALTELLPQASQRVRFNYDGFLRADTESRYAAHSAALAGKAFLTQNEVRDFEGYEPIEGGDVLNAPVPEPIAASKEDESV